MRDKKRIKKFIEKLSYDNLLKIFNFWEIPYTKEILNQIICHKSEIEFIWLINYDLRFSQIIIYMKLLNNYPGCWYFIEDNELLKILNENDNN